jgi:hypothetical protein
MANTFIFDDDDDQSNMGAPMPDQDDDQPDEGEGGNRTFTMILIGAGVVFLITLICVVVYLGVLLPQQKAATLAQNTSIVGTATQGALFAQQTQDAAQATPTLEPTQIPTEMPTNTPVVVIFATETTSSVGGDQSTTPDPATATVEALQTQLAAQQLTVTSKPKGTGTRTGTVTTTQLSQTGFADEVGLPGMFIIAVILLGVILLARRLREAPAR